MVKNILRCLLFFCIVLPAGCHAWHCYAQDTRLVLAASFPVYLFTKNICSGAKNIKTELLIPAAAGCPHDFALRPKDMLKLTKASVLVINGAGLEDFLEKPLKNLKNPPVVIDAGKNVPLIALNLFGQHNQNDGHEHNKTNPHIFASPALAIKMIDNIALELQKIDPANAGIYESNKKQLQKTLETLSLKLENIGKKAANKKIALEHDALAYLVQNAGLVAAVIFENTESVAQLKELKKKLDDIKPALMAGDSQYPDKLLKTLAAETGLPWAILNSCAAGPDNAPQNYYQTTMENNIKILEAYFDK